MRVLAAVLALALLGALGPVRPAGAGLPEAAARQVLARIEQQAAGVRTLASDLVQEKRLAVFQEVLVSRGRFYYERPDRLRWELHEPSRAGFALKGNQGRRWRDRGQVSEAFDVAREPGFRLVAEQLLAWARADLEGLARQYRLTVVAADPPTVRLVPLAAGATAYVEEVLVTFAGDARHVAAVEVREAGGDLTRIRFSHVVVNGPLAPDLF